MEQELQELEAIRSDVGPDFLGTESGRFDESTFSLDVTNPEEQVLPGPFANVVKNIGLSKESIYREMLRLQTTDIPNDDEATHQFAATR